MSSIQKVSSRSTPIAFCASSENIKIKNKYIKAWYSRKYGAYAPIRQHVPVKTSGFSKFCSLLKYYLL